MSGCGNDFIIVDNRNSSIEETDIATFITNICRRKMSVGADGIILIERSDTVDFRWRFYNSDGSTAEMCGNGARCAARFAFLNGIAGSEMAFETLAGMVSASVSDDAQVKIRMTDPSNLQMDIPIVLKSGTLTIHKVNTGVPHVGVFVDDIHKAPVNEMGREIRFHKDFAPAGTNVNFIGMLPDKTFAIRTYERGVEDETLACGTGSVACALFVAQKFGLLSPVRIMTRSGGCLCIYFTFRQGIFSDVSLEGDARVIYRAELDEEAWKYPAA